MSGEQRFEWAVGFVFRHEGDYVDDDQDPGGRTKYGIAERYFPEAWADGPPTRTDAKRLYREAFWDRYRCGELHPAWALAVFDGVVNQPGSFVVRALQETVGAGVDGILGPRTLDAANRHRSDWHLQMFMCRRLHRYVTRPHFARFGNGWMARVLDCYAEAATQL